MKFKVRAAIFETNSSSTNTLVKADGPRNKFRGISSKRPIEKVKFANPEFNKFAEKIVGKDYRRPVGFGDNKERTDLTELLHIKQKRKSHQTIKTLVIDCSTTLYCSMMKLETPIDKFVVYATDLAANADDHDIDLNDNPYETMYGPHVRAMEKWAKDVLGVDKIEFENADASDGFLGDEPMDLRSYYGIRQPKQMYTEQAIVKAFNKWMDPNTIIYLDYEHGAYGKTTYAYNDEARIDSDIIGEIIERARRTAESVDGVGAIIKTEISTMLKKYYAKDVWGILLKDIKQGLDGYDYDDNVHFKSFSEKDLDAFISQVNSAFDDYNKARTASLIARQKEDAKGIKVNDVPTFEEYVESFSK